MKNPENILLNVLLKIKIKVNEVQLKRIGPIIIIIRPMYVGKKEELLRHIKRFTYTKKMYSLKT